MGRNVEVDYFMERDFKDHAGEWVAICNRRVISSSVSITKVIREAKKKCGNKKPLFAKIPAKNQTLIL